MNAKFKVLGKNGGQRGIRTPEVVDKGFTVPPIWPLWNLPKIRKKWKEKSKKWFFTITLNFPLVSVLLEPLVGLEPTTIRLQGECSTNWAKVAIICVLAREILSRRRIKSNFFAVFFLHLIILGIISSFIDFMYTQKVKNFLEKKSDTPKLIVIFGPTASGKTDMSIEIAKYLDTEIISTDSRQIYKYMDIGTGKITPEEMQWVKHHMIDIVDPQESFSVWEFHARAKKYMEKMWSQWKIPLLVGGTWLYIESLIFDFHIPKIPASTSLRSTFETLSNDALYTKLMHIDPVYAQEIHPNNRPYIERALEVKILTGKSKKDFRTDKILTYDTLFLYPQIPGGHDVFSQEYREWLYERINQRVQMMFEQGWEQEIRGLLEKWYSFDDAGMNAIGYREFKDYISWEINKHELIKKIQQHSRNYAKRQITWFKKYKKYL